MQKPSPIVPPPKPRYRRFADLVLLGATAREAYLAAGFNAGTKSSADVQASRLLHRKEVASYIAAQQAAAVSATTLSLIEIREFCARVVRTGIGNLDPTPGSATGDLIKSHTSNETEIGNSFRIEKHDPFKAIEIDLKLSGADPQVESIRALAAAIGGLAPTSPLPTGKL